MDPEEAKACEAEADREPNGEIPSEDKPGPCTDCCGGCCRCLANIPCRTLSVLVVLIVGLGTFAGGSVVGFIRTRDLLGQDQLLTYFEFIIIGVCCGTIFFGLFFFFTGSLSTGWTARHVFNTQRKNACARCQNSFCMIVAAILMFLWIGIVCAFIVPITMLSMFYIIRNQQEAGDKNCVTLSKYGFTGLDTDEFCGQQFDNFLTKCHDVLLCYGIAAAAAIIVAVDLAFFMACIGADYAHLDESKYATLNAYKSEDKNSQESMLDTKM